MNEFRQHTPRFIDQQAMAQTIVLFNDIKELLSTDMIQNYTKDGNFSFFCMDENILIASYNDGFKWTVVGTIKYPEEVDLPKWNHGRYLTIDSTNHYVELDNKTIKYTCGGMATLLDGTKVKLVNF